MKRKSVCTTCYQGHIVPSEDHDPKNPKYDENGSEIGFECSHCKRSYVLLGAKRNAN